eukprot:3900645-Rhodomonas_salina.1
MVWPYASRFSTCTTTSWPGKALAGPLMWNEWNADARQSPYKALLFAAAASVASARLALDRNTGSGPSPPPPHSLPRPLTLCAEIRGSAPPRQNSTPPPPCSAAFALPTTSWSVEEHVSAYTAPPPSGAALAVKSDWSTSSWECAA